MYPAVVTLDQVKMVVLRTPEYWQAKPTKSSSQREGSQKSVFDFADFIRAFKVSRI